MNAQEQCFLNELKKTDTVTDKCLKDGFGAIITIKDENNEIKHKFGPDVTSLVDFCFIPKKNFLCVRRSSFVNNKEVEIGIVPQ
ncbi:hypothetical protein CL622_06570 [archaeon]|nr:hypothetical protein [archaeon]